VVVGEGGVCASFQGKEKQRGSGRACVSLHLEPRHVRVPGGEALRVLSGHSRRGAVWTAEDNRNLDLGARHVIHLGGRVDHVVDGLRGREGATGWARGPRRRGVNGGVG
jgi:hypothetical protein